MTWRSFALMPAPGTSLGPATAAGRCGETARKDCALSELRCRTTNLLVEVALFQLRGSSRNGKPRCQCIVSRQHLQLQLHVMLNPQTKFLILLRRRRTLA